MGNTRRGPGRPRTVVRESGLLHNETPAVVSSEEAGQRLREVFYALCAVVAVEVADDFPAQSQVAEAYVLYDDGEHAIAWKRLIAVLEGVIGEPIR